MDFENLFDFGGGAEREAERAKKHQKVRRLSRRIRRRAILGADTHSFCQRDTHSRRAQHPSSHRPAH